MTLANWALAGSAVSAARTAPSSRRDRRCMRETSGCGLNVVARPDAELVAVADAVNEVAAALAKDAGAKVASVEAIIAEAADAISGARPGARREDLEAYIKRIRSLEEMSMSFEGVQQAFAIQAGREVRIIVKPETIDDLASARLARDVAKKIEETMQYPGQIRVTVIRETRATEIAK